LGNSVGAGPVAVAPAPAANPQPGQPPAPPPANQQGQAPEVPVPVAVPGPTQLSAAKAAALQGVQTALDAMQSAQQSGNFAEYGQALQNLDDAMAKYREAK